MDSFAQPGTGLDTGAGGRDEETYVGTAASAVRRAKLDGTSPWPESEEEAQTINRARLVFRALLQETLE